MQQGVVEYRIRVVPDEDQETVVVVLEDAEGLLVGAFETASLTEGLSGKELTFRRWRGIGHGAPFEGVRVNARLEADLLSCLRAQGCLASRRSSR
ncbi:MAG: hypothetical protein HY221_00790 [Candidatus Sungbacteria bacterium]|uniref:Uncharacterized protein n=1 Tax=Candidatus Sungiibacteriota bacterium TaxID=2750080 RepID=A0A932QZS4_9BACT|nr:hypothetical protein [Candidatus Sungbacteria bacterium]